MLPDKRSNLPGPSGVHNGFDSQDPRWPVASAGRQEIDFGRLGGALWRSRWLMLGITALALGVAAIVTALQDPVYESEATMLIDGENRGLDLIRGLVPSGLSGLAGLESGGSDIETDLAVLRSRQVAESVVDSLGLRVVLADRGMARDSVLRVISAPRGTQQGIYRLERLDDRSYAIRKEAGDTGVELPERVVVGEPFHVGEVTLALQTLPDGELPDRVRFQILSFRAAVGEFRERLRVVRPTAAKVLGIQFRSPDPVVAAGVPNAVAASFLDFKNRMSRAEATSTLDFLQDQARTYEGELRSAEARLQAFKEQARVVEPTTQATEQIRRVAEVQAERDALQAERQSLQRLLARVDGAPDGRMGSAAYRQLAAFPSFITNGAVQEILRSLMQLDNERAELLVRRTEQNVDVQGIDSRIGLLERSLYQLVRNYLSGVENRLTSLDAALAGYATEMQQVPAREVEFLRLTREQKLLEQVHVLIQTRLKEEQINSAADAANVRLIDAALVPERPSYPRSILNLTLAALLGLMLSAGIVFVREVRDRRLRSAEEVAAAAWGVPVLGVIPVAEARLPGSNGGRPHLPGWARKALPGRAELPAHQYEEGSMPEAYRSLHTTLTLAHPATTPQVRVVAGTGPDDATAITAVNLAMAFAQQEVKTLLVDADLRQGEISRSPGFALEPGVAELLLQSLSLEEVVREIPTGAAGARLHFLSAGVPPAHPAELLSPRRIAELLAGLRKRYEMIIVHAPPVSAVSDAVLLGKKADGMLLVARLGVTDRETLAQAAATLHRLGVAVEGIVVNDVARSAARNGHPSPPAIYS
ncbi:polysaccharide biosynthesis tyrosine autokinase [soil metagenome]